MSTEQVSKGNKGGKGGKGSDVDATARAERIATALRAFFTANWYRLGSMSLADYHDSKGAKYLANDSYRSQFAAICEVTTPEHIDHCVRGVRDTIKVSWKNSDCQRQLSKENYRLFDSMIANVTDRACECISGDHFELQSADYATFNTGKGGKQIAPPPPVK